MDSVAPVSSAKEALIYPLTFGLCPLLTQSGHSKATTNNFKM